MTDKYINLIAVEELFNQEKSSIHNDESLDYSTKRMLTNELDRLWQTLLRIPIRKILPKENSNCEFYGTDNEHNSLYEIDSYRNLLKIVYNDLNNIFLETPESCCQICIYKNDYCDDCDFKYIHDEAIKQLMGDNTNE